MQMVRILAAAPTGQGSESATGEKGERKVVWSADSCNFPRGASDPYAVCVFLPMMDLSPTVGFTQFWPGSHRYEGLVGRFVDNTCAAVFLLTHFLLPSEALAQHVRFWTVMSTLLCRPAGRCCMTTARCTAAWPTPRHRPSAAFCSCSTMCRSIRSSATMASSRCLMHERPGNAFA